MSVRFFPDGRLIGAFTARIRVFLNSSLSFRAPSIVTLFFPVLFLLPLLSLAVRTSMAQSVALKDIESKLSSIRSEVAAYGKQLVALQEQQKRTQKSIAEQKKTLTSLATESQRLNDRLQAIADERKRAEETVSEAEGKKEAAQKQAAKRLRVLYMANEMSLARGLLERTSVSELDRTIVYLAKIRSADTARFREVAKFADDARAASNRLEALVREQTAAADQLNAKRISADAAMASSRELNKQLATQKDAITASLKSLKREAERLEGIIASITSGALESSVPESEERATPSPVRDETSTLDSNPGNKSATPAASLQSSTPKPARGEIKLTGLFGSKVVVERPVSGRVVTGYGKSRVGDLKEEVFNKGLEYSAKPGSEASAIADGRVVYIGQLPTYGNVVIIDHGQRSYSLYGRLDAVQVGVSTDIGKGELVGTIGEPDDQGRNFYFEIRRNGIPVNPTTVLKGVR